MAVSTCQAAWAMPWQQASATAQFFTGKIPSSMGHVESRVNLRGPPRKAKYS